MTAMADGARLAHLFCKEPPPWIEVGLDSEGTMHGMPRHADVTAAPWHKLWNVGVDFYSAELGRYCFYSAAGGGRAG